MPVLALPRPVERVAIVTMMLVFLSGTVVGAMVMSYWFHPDVHGTRSAGGLTMSIKEWKEQLDLTDEQTRQLTSVLDDFSLFYDHLLSDGNTRVLQILNAEQKLKYEKMMRDHKR